MKIGFSATKGESAMDARDRMAKYVKQLGGVASEVLEEERKTIYSEVVAEVPFSSGKLASSIRVTVSRSQRRPGINASASARSRKGYNYAGIQHENEEFFHPNGRKAHFLSDPMDRSSARLMRTLPRKLRPPGGLTNG